MFFPVLNTVTSYNCNYRSTCKFNTANNIKQNINKDTFILKKQEKTSFTGIEIKCPSLKAKDVPVAARKFAKQYIKVYEQKGSVSENDIAEIINKTVPGLNASYIDETIPAKYKYYGLSYFTLNERKEIDSDFILLKPVSKKKTQIDTGTHELSHVLQNHAEEKNILKIYLAAKSEGVHKIKDFMSNDFEDHIYKEIKKRKHFPVNIKEWNEICSKSLNKTFKKYNVKTENEKEWVIKFITNVFENEREAFKLDSEALTKMQKAYPKIKSAKATKVNWTNCFFTNLINYLEKGYYGKRYNYKSFENYIFPEKCTARMLRYGVDEHK